MAKFFSTNALDAAFDYVASRADLLSLCVGAPATATEAATLQSGGGRMVASAQLTPGLGGADFVIADGATSGRRLIIAAKGSVIVAETGTIDHVALVDSVSGELLSVSELTEPQPGSPGQILSVRSFSEEIQAPA